MLFFITKSIILILILIFLPLIVYIRMSKRSKRTIAFFHPKWCAGGGGEKVLWQSIEAISDVDYDIFIYTTPNDLDNISNTIKQYDLSISRNRVNFVYLKSFYLTEPKRWPYATLIATAMASTLTAIEACLKHSPDILVDTVGFPFIVPVFKLLTFCRIVCYVHYPTISTDMLEPVRSGSIAVNNSKYVSQSPFLSQIKLFYYKCFSFMYSMCGRFVDLAMVNSKWTFNHIDSLWHGTKCTIVYPPCDVKRLLKLSNEISIDKRKCEIISVAHFRPEKRLEFQVDILESLIEKHKDLVLEKNLKWVFAGGCNSPEDVERVYALKKKIKEKGLDQYASIRMNLSRDDLEDLMINGLIGIHTMYEEHFGIAVVDCMCAGLITIANNSGGPKLDIINHTQNGYLALTKEEYTERIVSILKDSKQSLEYIQSQCKELEKFDNSIFRTNFYNQFKTIC